MLPLILSMRFDLDTEAYVTKPHLRLSVLIMHRQRKILLKLQARQSGITIRKAANDETFQPNTSPNDPWLSSMSGMFPFEKRGILPF